MKLSDDFIWGFFSGLVVVVTLMLVYSEGALR